MTIAARGMRRPPRALALTEDLVARVARDVPKTDIADRHDRLTPMTDADRLALADRLLQENAGADFWVFGYGSLIWKPAFDYVETRQVAAHGWRRHYSLEVHSWRGTLEQPGLMLALEQGGSCHGVAYKLPPDDQKGRMLRFVERETTYHEDAAKIRWITVRGEGRVFRALTSWVAVRNDTDFLRLPIAEQAQRLARAVGYLGSCAEYLRNTVLHLEEMGIRDSYLWTLQELVANEIKALHPRSGD